MMLKRIKLELKTYFFIVGLILLHSSIFSQVTMLLQQIPASTPSDADIYISGNFEGWSGGAAPYRLGKNDFGEYFITLPQRQGSIQYKFTRGSWASVEKGAQGEEISNRVYNFGGNGDTVLVQIATWADGTSGSTASPNVSVAHSSFSMMPFFNRNRTIRIYLPPDYEANTDRRYPVLYMQDGQNLFDQLTSFAGEWEVDETLDRLFEEVDFGLIVVGIDNGGSARVGEYTPWTNPTYGGGDGDKYTEFMVQVLKPFIDANYRTRPDAANTGVMGSSLGGLIAHYSALKYPDVFSKAGVFSPSFWYSDSSFVFASQHSDIQTARHYFLAGTNESSDMVEQMEQMIDVMIEGGFESEGINKAVIQGGNHNEALWRNNFEIAVKWLFEDLILSSSEKKSNSLTWKLFPNPTADVFWITFEGRRSLEGQADLEVFDLRGNKVLERQVFEQESISVSQLLSGIYIVRVSDGELTRSQLLIRH